MKLALIILGWWFVVSLVAAIMWSRFMDAMGAPDDDY